MSKSVFCSTLKKEWKLPKKYATLLENAERKVYKYTMDEKELANLRKQAEAIRFSAYNHIELALAEPDHAVFRLNIRPESKNSYNIVHGGALYTMADNASGFAAHSDGRSYVTQSGSLHFIRNRSEGEIRAEARVRHRGRATCLVSVDICDEQGILLATGEFAFFCIGEAAGDGEAPRR